MLGLARAFFAAGSRSVLASLWNVHDERTARFMEDFYRRLAAGASKGEALRQTKLAALRRGGEAAAPRDWAAFVLIGEAGASIPLSRGAQPAPWPAILGAVLASALAVAVWVLARSRRAVREQPTGLSD